MINWVHAELVDWGKWAARSDDRKGDFPGQVAFTDPTPRASGNRDHPFERVPADFEIIDQGVRMLHPEKVMLVIAHFYKNGCGIRRTAAVFHCSPQTVVNYRDKAHEFLAPHITKLKDKVPA